MRKHLLKFSDLEKEAGQLSSFTGSESYESDFSGGAPKFHGARTYRMQIIHKAGGTDEDIIILPGVTYVRGSEANGEVRTALVGAEFPSADGTALQYAAIGSPASIETFLCFVAQVPMRILGLRLKSTDATQLDQALTVERQSPFNKTNMVKSYELSQYTDEYAQNDKIATIPFENQFDGQTKVTLTTVVGSTNNITIFIGELDNAAARFAES